MKIFIRVGGGGESESERLVSYALEIGALELIPEGRQLKSGRISPYFFNSALFKSGEALSRLAKAYVAKIKGQQYHHNEIIFGPAYKGIPLAVAVTLEIGGSICCSFNRKETKGHGEGGDIVGASVKGADVVVVDDVITTGDSIREAVKVITANGGNVIGCIICFDRQEKAVDSELSAVQKLEQELGLKIESAACLADLINVLQQAQDINPTTETEEILQKILKYQDEYGVNPRFLKHCPNCHQSMTSTTPHICDEDKVCR